MQYPDTPVALSSLSTFWCSVQGSVCGVSVVVLVSVNQQPSFVPLLEIRHSNRRCIPSSFPTSMHCYIAVEYHITR